MDYRNEYCYSGNSIERSWYWNSIYIETLTNLCRRLYCYARTEIERLPSYQNRSHSIECVNAICDWINSRIANWIIAKHQYKIAIKRSTVLFRFERQKGVVFKGGNLKINIWEREVRVGGSFSFFLISGAEKFLAGKCVFIYLRWEPGDGTDSTGRIYSLLCRLWSNFCRQLFCMGSRLYLSPLVV